MLTARQRLSAVAGGASCLAAIGLFIAIAVGALLSLDAGPNGAVSFFDPVTLSILRFTLWQAGLSTVLSVGLAIVVARALARQARFAGRVWLVRLMAVPMGLPVLIGALGLVGIWGRKGVVNEALVALGAGEPFSIYGLFGILLAHVFFNLPLATRLMLSGLERIPGEYWLMSAGLGMKPLSIFRFIEWPVLRPLIPGIAGLVFMLCATSFTLVLVLGGGPAATTIEVAIYQALRFDFDPSRAVSLALLQIIVTAIILGAMALFPAPRDPGTTLGRATRRLDGESFLPRLSDGLVLCAAILLIGSPLLSILVAGASADLGRLLTEKAFLSAAGTSLAIALSAGMLAVGACVAIVRAQAAVETQRRQGLPASAFSALLSGASSLVLLVPTVVLATGWFMVLWPLGGIARFAPVVVIAINALMALPFAIRVIEPAFRSHRLRTDRLAASLGLSGFDRLRLVDWPVLKRPLLMGLSFAMALSLGDLGAVALFGSENLATLPWLIYSRMGSYRTNDADGLALILGAVCLVLTLAGTTGRSLLEKESR
ncbi:MAG: thiamine/thiamine pyrophosphate ABC transporter permease ThiP [Allorhizobium sp.]